MRDDDRALHLAARAAIKARKVPDRYPDRTWGGPGAGFECAICDSTVTADESELELEFSRSGLVSRETYHVHVRCFMIWELERDDLAKANGAVYGSLSASADAGYNGGRERRRPVKPGPG